MSRRRKLLLADDSPTVRKVISLTFADEGVEVVTAADGREALRLLEDGPPPDVILADAVMPGPDGYELCERVRRDPRLRHIPVVLLVGTFEPFNEAEARRVGAETVLTKPFQSIRDLVSKVGSLLGGESKPESEGRGHESHAAEGHRELAEDVQTRPAAAANTAQDINEARADAARRAAAFGREPERDPAPGATAERDAVERESPETAAHDDPAASFADLGADDELIEARPAEAFGGGTAAHAPSGFADAPAEFADTPAEFADSLDDPREREPQPAASMNVPTDADHFAMNEDASRFDADDAAPAARPAFAAQAAGLAAADDALLDLGQIEPPASAAAAEADDFVLDLDDDDFAAPPAASAPAAHASPFNFDDLIETPADAPGAFAEAAHGETAAEEATRFSAEPVGEFWPPRGESEAPFAEPASPSFELSASHGEAEAARTPFEFSALPAETEARDSELSREVIGGDVPPFAGAGAPEGAFGAARYDAPEAGVAHDSQPFGAKAFIEPQVVPAEEPTPGTFESEFTDGSVEGDVPRPAPFIPDAPAPPRAPFAEPTSTAGYAMGEARAGVDESAAPAQLSPETIDAIARRVVELMSDKVVREIAWEVVPDLAELLIRRRLDEERNK